MRHFQIAGTSNFVSTNNYNTLTWLTKEIKNTRRNSSLNYKNIVKVIIMNLEIGIRQSAAKFLNAFILYYIIIAHGKGSETRW